MSLCICRTGRLNITLNILWESNYFVLLYRQICNIEYDKIIFLQVVNSTNNQECPRVI